VTEPNPELLDAERNRPSDPKAAVVQQAKLVRDHIDAAAEGMKELQALMKAVPAHDIDPKLAPSVADLRISLIEQSQSLRALALLPVVIGALYEGRP
jgi:hypothetical protein